MELTARADEVASGAANRRAAARHDVDEDAHLLLMSVGTTHSCRIVDLSLTGCRVRTNEKFPGGVLRSVEVVFKVRGLAFRFCGITQWTDGRHLAGIRFAD